MGSCRSGCTLAEPRRGTGDLHRHALSGLRANGSPARAEIVVRAASRCPGEVPGDRAERIRFLEAVHADEGWRRGIDAIDEADYALDATAPLGPLLDAFAAARPGDVFLDP